MEEALSSIKGGRRPLRDSWRSRMNNPVPNSGPTSSRSTMPVGIGSWTSDGEASLGLEGNFKLLIYINKNIR